MLMTTTDGRPFEGIKFQGPCVPSALVRDWPAGGKRVTARFERERRPDSLERIKKTTTGAPKSSPWARIARVAISFEGKHYVIGEKRNGRLFIMPPRMRTVYFPKKGSKLWQTINKSLNCAV